MTIRSKLARIAAAAMVIVTATIGAVTLFPGAAEAHNSFSCTGYGWIRFPFTHVASSRWCGQTNGSGRYVSSIGGGFTNLIAGVYLCNTSMKAEFFDDHGHSVGAYYSGVTRGCWQAGGVFSVSVNRTFKTDGYVRISLLSYGAEQAAVQQNIKSPKSASTPKPSPSKSPTPTIKAAAKPAPTPSPTIRPISTTAHSLTTISPTAAPRPAQSQSAPRTHSETAGGLAHTWTNYTSAGGKAGPVVAGGQTIQIACKVTGFRVPDGNAWWYRIVSSPWNQAYYVSADAFYNNGHTSGSLSGTPFFDPTVPNC